MSYIYNSDGVKSNNPINETNTNFDNNSISKQNMFTGEPVSQYDAEYLNEYRSQIEQLRSRTESMNMALEAALVPSIVKGTSVYLKQIPEEVNKLRSYVFNDHLSQYGRREIVFKCDMVKFRSDRRRRLCYDRTVKMYTKQGDTIQSIIENVILEYVPTMTYEKFIDKNYDLHTKKANSVLEGGIEIDTCIPTTLYNLVKLRYVKPFLAFVNNLAISWDNTSISVDNNTTYVIINMKDGDLTYRPNTKDYPNTKFQYLDLPFQVDYIRAGDSITVTEGGVTKYKYDKSYLDKEPIFCFNSNMGGIVSNNHYNSLKSSYSWFANSNGYERIFTKDPFVIYQEFDLDTNSLTDGSISNLGLLYNKKLNDFGYMSKIKQFNMICFEQVVSNDESHGGYIRDDFEVESHQFNILKIDLKTIDNKKRRFKVFYNTRVLYDQDNMLRLGSKNMPDLEAEFYAYMKDVSSNVQTFIDEIYKLQQKDVGIYEDSDGNEYMYDSDSHTFISKTTSRVVNAINYVDYTTYPIKPEETSGLVLKNVLLGNGYYKNSAPDHLRIRQEILHMNNMEEGSTCDDEFIYYCNPNTKTVLRELANQIFKEDEPIILQTIYDLIDRMNASNYFGQDNYVHRSVKNEWFIRKHLAEMFLYDLDEWYSLGDMGILDEVFDFTYKDTLSYKENLTNAVDYIVGYDADKLESTIHRGVVSITRTGSELQQFISNNTLIMPTWGGFNKRDNYVMIFRNGILYSKYGTIKYEGDSFKVTMTNDDYSTDDKFEFVFFLNVNNTILKTTLRDNSILGNYITSNSVGCNTSVFDPENVIGMIDKIPENEYNDHIDFSLNKTSYILNNTIRYVKKSGYEKDDGSIGITTILSYDYKSNGLYNISKQGGGDYLINFNYKNKSGKTIEVLNGTEVTLCSSRQFRYQRTYAGASSSTFTITLNDDFKYVLSANNILVFKNGYVVPRNSVFIRPTNNTPIDKCKLYLDIAVSANDRIEIFYLPNSLEFMNSEVTNGSIRYNPNNEPIKRMSPTNYIRFTSPLYGVSSKHSLFVFLNGRKIPMSDMEDVSNTIIKITTNQTSYDRLEIYSHLDQDESNHKVFIKDGLEHNKTSDSIDFSTMDSYKEPSKLDKLINTSTDEKLNNFFGDASSTDTATHIDQSFYSKESVIDRIKNDYILAGDPDAWIALIET